MKLIKFLLVLSLMVAFSCSQQQEELTEEDYRRAESFLYSNTRDLVSGTISRLYWQSDGNLIYRRSTGEGNEYVLADISTGEKDLAFDHDKLAQSLTDIAGDEVSGDDMRLADIQINDGQLSYRFSGKNYVTDLSNYETAASDQSTASRKEHLSPDHKKAAYIKDNNLWIRNTVTDERIQLTFDGEENYGYGTNNAGWDRMDAPVLLWSPNSDKIATFRHDGRGVGEMYLYTTEVGHSKLDQWKYPLPGDSLIFRIERVVIHLDEPKPRLVKLDMPPDPHRSTTHDHVANRSSEFLDVEWNDDASYLSFVSSSRDHKEAELKIADPNTGTVRSVLKEVQDTYYEGGFSEANWRVLPASDEVIWFSERSNWGHLYLYDLTTGALKNPITSGEWAVLDVEHVDEENRVIYFTGSNKEEGDPYFHYLYKINFDGSGLELLTPEMAHHSISWSDSKAYFVDNYSTPTTPPVAVVRDRNGEVKMKLETADISRLEEAGWVPPIPFITKARDGETDLYGLMYTPSNMDESKKYPVLNYLYPGPQTGSVRSRSFYPSRSDKQAVAELGFVVVEVDAMGTPGRSKSFHDAYYGNMGDNGLPDQITTIEQLAERHSFMDIDKVGIWGHSGGGFASTAGILRYPDFYKVAVSSSGNHDNRNYEDDWGEKWHGLLVENADAEAALEGVEIDPELQEKVQGDNYDKQANQLLAGNLKGKLLLAHGMLDDNVPPTSTLLVAEALMDANKEFDMLMLPNARHGYGKWYPYFMKKRWNYFIEHLKGIEPIHEFEFEED